MTDLGVAVSVQDEDDKRKGEGKEVTHSFCKEEKYILSCRTHLGTIHMPYPWIRNSYSSQERRERDIGITIRIVPIVLGERTNTDTDVTINSTRRLRSSNISMHNTDNDKDYCGDQIMMLKRRTMMRNEERGGQGEKLLSRGHDDEEEEERGEEVENNNTDG